MFSRFRATTSIFLACWFLVACGGSSNSIDEITINARLNQGEQWQENLDLGSFSALTQAPQHGELSIAGNQVTYVPQPAFRGADSAIIEGQKALYTLRFEVAAVNQPPVLVNTEIQVLASREIAGVLEVYDQDNDPITFTLLSAPENGTLTLSDDGHFTYVPGDLILPNAQFTVAISDGVNAAVEANVLLMPAYRSNEEKAAYYYFSAHSHLGRSERLLATINSDIDTESAYTKLAKGYVAASMDAEVERIVSQHISSQAGQANAYRELAVTYWQRNEEAQATAYLQQSADTYAQLIVDNGPENMVMADGQFYLTLMRVALNTNNMEVANAIAQQLRVFLAELGGGEYKNAVGFIAQAARTNAVALVDEYLQTGNVALYEQAVENIDLMAFAAQQAGYQDSAARPRHFRLAPLYSVWAAEQYFFMGELEKAKLQLARTLAFYGDVTYDEAYPFTARSYADATLNHYDSPLREASVLFSVLYPELENYPLALIAEYASATAYTRAETAVNAMSYFLRVLNDGTGNNAIDQVLNEIEAQYGSNQRTLVGEIVETSAQFPKLAALLWRFGLREEAEVAYKRAFAIITSAEYAAQNAGTPRFMTGNNGCFRVVQRVLVLGNTELAQYGAEQCASLLAVVTSGHFENLLNVMHMYISVEQPEFAEALLSQAAYALENELESGVARARGWFDIARVAARVEAYSQALDYVENGFAQLELAPVATVADIRNQLTSLNKLVDTSISSGVYEPTYGLIEELRRRAYNSVNYQAYLQFIQQRLVTALTGLQQNVLERPVAEQDQLVAHITPTLAYARLYNSARQLLQQLSVGEAERLQNLAVIAAIQAEQDDFPASPIATVDTDGDGRANFFAVAATPEQLAATDIQLDDDADGDGVVDEEDPQPLGPPPHE